ncbi:hypothetical protein CEXT_702771 [Caerostris extrusa]|uniref:Uncharacterized protein n=1 Tax=Caerostris extrusa TaxID=172846 RepID=A0AAV4Q965_CAEEX|nr:hypothetical protein CEXT_702771 [Caerostris extrusa]
MTYARVEEWQRTLQVRGGVLLPHSVQESSSNYLPIQRVQPLKKATLFFPADSEMAYLLLLLYPCPESTRSKTQHIRSLFQLKNDPRCGGLEHGLVRIVWGLRLLFGRPQDDCSTEMMRRMKSDFVFIHAQDANEG